MIFFCGAGAEERNQHNHTGAFMHGFPATLPSNLKLGYRVEYSAFSLSGTWSLFSQTRRRMASRPLAIVTVFGSSLFGE